MDCLEKHSDGCALTSFCQESGKYDLPFGVPQGNCLGPLLFLLYMVPFGNINKKYRRKGIAMLMTSSFIFYSSLIMTTPSHC